MPARVMHLSSVHPWDDNRIFRRECMSLARHGYDVTLVATGTGPPAADGGVHLVVHERPTMRVRRMVTGVARVLWTAWRAKADVYHLHDPELAPIIPLLKLRGARVVYDAHEDLPVQLLSKPYLPWWSRRAISLGATALCAFVDRTADQVVSATPRIAERFSSPALVRNYPELLPGVDGTTTYDAREHVVVYVGGMAPARGAQVMVDAFAAADLPPDWSLWLIGPHSPSTLIDELSGRPGWSRVVHHGRIPPLEARALVSRARIGLVLFQPTPAHVDAMPTKLFEYMAAGIPVIASDFPLWRDIVTDAGCGLLVDPTDARAVADAIETLASDPVAAERMGASGRAAALERLNWEREEHTLLSVYSQLTSS